MREQHRLGVLQVRAARHDRGRVPLRLRSERVDEIDEQSGDAAPVLEQEQADERGDLVVAAAAGAQASAELRTDLEDEGGFERADVDRLGADQRERCRRRVVDP